jgi:peptidoglycan/LPS O-acetylase OafA/YrhL
MQTVVTPSEVAPGRIPAAVLYGALAAMLIFNSHLESFYPMPWLAGDGLLGNSMFFFLSGWGIARSWQQVQRGFLDFMQRRLLRLYPGVLLAMLVLFYLPHAGWSAFDFSEHLQFFVYPTPFTYVRVILPGYLLLFLALRFVGIARWRWLLILLGTLYFGQWLLDFHQGGLRNVSLGLISDHYHFLFYFAVLIAGAAYGGGAIKSFGPLWLAPLFTLTYIGCKLLSVVSHLGILFPLLHMLCFLALGPLFESMDRLAHALSWRPIQSTLNAIGQHTLEIYLTHSLLITERVVERLGVPFALQIPALIVLTTIASVALKRGSDWIRSRVPERA